MLPVATSFRVTEVPKDTMVPFRYCSSVVLRLWWSAYLLSTALYCLLAYLPYTYSVLIKSPIYGWIPWFQRNHAPLYWTVFLTILIVFWSQRAGWLYRIANGALLLVGLAVSI